MLSEETKSPSPCLVAPINQHLCLCGGNNKRFCCFTSPLVFSFPFLMRYNRHGITEVSLVGQIFLVDSQVPVPAQTCFCILSHSLPCDLSLQRFCCTCIQEEPSICVSSCMSSPDWENLHVYAGVFHLKNFFLMCFLIRALRW